MTHGAPKQRNNYNHYDAYSNEYFSRLFHGYIHTGLIMQQEAAAYLKIPASTLSSKYCTWLAEGRQSAGTMDRRGGKRKLSIEDEATVGQQLHARIDAGQVSQNGHLVDFIMNLQPEYEPSIGFLSRLKKRLGLGSRMTAVIKKKKEKTPVDEDDECDALAAYYENVVRAIDRYGASGVWNYDEKPLSTAPRKVSTMQRTGQKARPMTAASGDPDRVYTAACAAAANGNKAPLMIIKKGVMMASASSQLVAEAVEPYDNYMHLTASGWVTGNSMEHWIRHVFAVNVALPCALTMDGYGAHWTPEVRAAADALKIELIDMPANRTNEIQPLDVGVFGALQAMADRDWSVEDSVIEYIQQFQQAWIEFKPESIRKAFYKALALADGILENAAADANARRVLVEEQDAVNMIDYIMAGFMDAVPHP
jgi:hypothetical protein